LDERDIRQIPLTALFAALGIILPQFFHLIGLGSIFLPLFLPVTLGSMLLRWRFAVALGIICPLLSWIITGMPPLVPPILPVLITELAVLSLTVSLIHVHLKKSFWIALVAGIIFDRLVLFIIIYLITPFFGLEHPVFKLAFITAGIPGIILQLTTIPLGMMLIRKQFPHLIQRVREN